MTFTYLHCVDSCETYHLSACSVQKDDLDGEIDLKSCVKVCEFDVEKNYGFQVQVSISVTGHRLIVLFFLCRPGCDPSVC